MITMHNFLKLLFVVPCNTSNDVNIPLKQFESKTRRQIIHPIGVKQVSGWIPLPRSELLGYFSTVRATKIVLKSTFFCLYCILDSTNSDNVSET